MSKTYRLLGLPSCAIDTQTNEIKFDLAVSNGNPVSFIAKYGIIAQMLAGLARPASQLRDRLNSIGTPETVYPEAVVEVGVQQNKITGVILVELINQQGIPYTFALPPQTAIRMADLLKSETSKVTEMGTA